jgi:multidrug resistance efflux pump
VARTSGDVIAEAVIEPARWSQLSLEVPGEVTEVLAQAGDQVTTGTLLLRLDTEDLEIQIQSARQDVIAQQAALDRLIQGTQASVIARADKDNADQIAQAEVALQAATLQLDKARAEDPATNVDVAQARIEQLQLQLAQARAQSPYPDVKAAQVNVERAKIALDDAHNEYKKALDRPWEDQAVRDGWSRQIDQKELDYRLAQAQLEGAQSAQRAHAIQLDVLAAQIEDAETGLAQALAAQEAYAVSLEMLANDVASARLRLESLQTWDNPYRDKATSQEIAQAEARLRQTELAVDALVQQTEDAELRAPFAGTVVDVYTELGDRVTPAETVVVLATLDQLQARTTDLTELDIARVAVGQPAVLAVDAFPDQEFPGEVTEISLQAEDYRGDVVYAVTIDLLDPGVPLRWGMTTMVTLDTP